MACISIPFNKPDKLFIERFSWVNWSDVGREEVQKREIFERYLKTGEVTDEDWEFCEKIDWHPVDWLPEKKEFRKKVEAAKKGPFIRFNSAADLFKE